MSPHIVIHGTPVDANLIVWAETNQPQDHQTEPNDFIPHHPNAATMQQLEQMVHTIAPYRNVVTRANANVWLPTIHDNPVHSSPDLRPQRLPEQIPIKPWAVPAVRIQHSDIPRFLARANDLPHPERDRISTGPDLAFWHQVTTLMLSMLARHAYIPDFDSNAAHLTARWSPAFWPHDHAALLRLAQLMPAAAGALHNSTQRNATPPRPPTETLTAYIHEWLDRLIFDTCRNSAANLPKTHRNEYSVPSTAADAWFDALTRKTNRRPQSNDQARNKLLENHRSWTAPMRAAQRSRRRLTVELMAPNNDTPWQLVFHLQDKTDQNDLVTAEQTWQQATDTKEGRSPTRELITALVADAGVFSPTIAHALTQGKVLRAAISTQNAHDFIINEAPLLPQAGIPVHLPPLWTEENGRHPLSFLARIQQADGTINFSTIFNYDWRVSLGDDPITEEELTLLARAAQPLIQIRDRWLAITNRHLQETLRSILGRPRRYATTIQLMQMNSGQPLGLPDNFQQQITAHGQLGQMLHATGGQAINDRIPPPELLEGHLWSFQELGYAWLYRMTAAGLGACLADDMGLGKTIQVLATILRHKEDGHPEPCLIVCPTSVIRTWLTEADKFTPAMRLLAHHGPDRPRNPEEFVRKAQNTDAIVTSYDTAHRDRALLAQVQWLGVYLDEAQNIKNHSSRRAQTCRMMPARHRVAITGTPVENHLGDLWSIIEFTNPNLLGDQKTFQTRYQDPANATRRTTRPFILRRLKTDPALDIDLPDRINTTDACHLTREQAALYTAVLSDLDQALQDHSQRNGAIFSAITKLKQICNHPAHFLHDGNHEASRSGKLTRLLQMLEETFAAGDKAVIFTDFVEMGRIIQEQVGKHTGDSPLLFHGGLTTDDRNAAIDTFQSGGTPRSIVVSMRAGGTGIQLTAANHVFLFDRWWNPAIENQAIDRVNRPGQHKLVQVHTMTCPGTLEENIASIISNKTDLAKNAIATGDQWLRNLNPIEIRAALAMGQTLTED